MEKFVVNHDRLVVRGKNHTMNMVIKTHLFNNLSTMLVDWKSELRHEETCTVGKEAQKQSKVAKHKSLLLRASCKRE
jgi:hypothetical protein